MIPSSERASERLTSILSSAEWVTRRNERGGDHYIARDRLGRESRDDSTKSVWTGSLSMSRRGRPLANETRPNETVDETVGTAMKSTFGSGNLEYVGASSAQASDADVSDGEERAPSTSTRLAGRASHTIDDLSNLVQSRTITCQLVASSAAGGGEYSRDGAGRGIRAGERGGERAARNSARRVRGARGRRLAGCLGSHSVVATVSTLSASRDAVSSDTRYVDGLQR